MNIKRNEHALPTDAAAQLKHWTVLFQRAGSWLNELVIARSEVVAPSLVSKVTKTAGVLPT